MTARKTKRQYPNLKIENEKSKMENGKMKLKKEHFMFLIAISS